MYGIHVESLHPEGLFYTMRVEIGVEMNFTKEKRDSVKTLNPFLLLW